MSNTVPVEVPITSFPAGSIVLSTDVYPAVDTTDHSQSSSGTTKKYTIQQLSSYFNTSITSNRISCVVVSTTNLSSTYNNGSSGIGATLTASSSGAFIVDGVTVSLNSRVLVSAQTSTLQNGIYSLTNAGSVSTSWVLTRTTDFDTPSTVQEGTLVAISEGTVNNATLWIETGQGPFTIGTTPIIFTNASASVDGIVPLSKGGTNANLTANNGGIFYSTSNAGAILSGTPTSGKILQSGSSSAPSWSTPTYPSSSGTTNHYLYSDGTNNLYSLHALSLGGDITTGGSLTLAGNFSTLFNISGDTNVTFPTSGTLATTGQLYDYVSVTTATQAILPNIIYYINYSGGQCMLTLPETINLGDVFFVRGNSSGGWIIQASGSQVINIGNVPSSPGGSVASQNQFDAIELSAPETDVLTIFPASNQFTIL